MGVNCKTIFKVKFSLELFPNMAIISCVESIFEAFFACFFLSYSYLLTSYQLLKS